MESTKHIKTKEDALKLLNIALEHEWAVSFEYTVHAYSMPKATFFYVDPIMRYKTDARAQTIQIGIDEMYHSLQLGIIIKQMGGEPSFKTDEIIRYPKVIDNFRRDKMTEDLVTNLYQSAEFEGDSFPKIQNMILNISYDEVRHAAQFSAMMEAMKAEGQEEALCYQSNPDISAKEKVQLLHDIMVDENELLHRYLYHTIMFSEHQDLSQRLFKNSIDHMRHWDKNSGILIKMGDVVKIENAEKDSEGTEKSARFMPDIYPGDNRLSALETLIPTEEKLVRKYERLMAMMPEGEIKQQLEIHLAQNHEHVFTQQWLLTNAKKFSGIL